MNVLGRFRAGLSRTKQQFIGRFDEVFGRAGDAAHADRPVGDETLESLEEILISADVGVAATERILGSVRSGGARGGNLRERVQAALLEILQETSPAAAAPSDGQRPEIILIVGVNGTGKTTTIGKLARHLREEGREPVICAADTFRAAAVEQLDIWARRAGVDIVRAQQGADPAAVVYDAIAAGKARGRDVVLIDTAGRLHTRVNLMTELEKIRRVAAREVPGAPHHVWLVLDATVGQNGLAQAREFMQVAGVNGIVLTKLDGTARGGVAVAIAQDLKLPIRFVGVGEGIEDLVPFSPEAYVSGLFAESW